MTPSRFDCTVAAETNDAVQGLPQEKGQTDGMRDRLVLTSHCVLLFPVETRSTERDLLEFILSAAIVTNGRRPVLMYLVSSDPGEDKPRSIQRTEDSNLYPSLARPTYHQIDNFGSQTSQDQNSIPVWPLEPSEPLIAILAF